MPFSSVLGASSVIKPGVCTSTTRPTVPYIGQLIFETDTSRLAVWTGSAWQYETAAAGPPGLVYITGASFSAVSSVSLPNNTFTSTYKNYKVVVEFTDASVNNAAITMRLRAAGSDNTAASYSSNIVATAVSGTTQYNSASSGATSFGLGSVRATYTNDQNMFVFDLQNPQTALVTTYVGNAIMHPTASLLGMGSIGGHFDNTTSFDSLSVIIGSGTITGNYRVYGYTDS